MENRSAGDRFFHLLPGRIDRCTPHRTSAVDGSPLFRDRKRHRASQSSGTVALSRAHERVSHRSR
jgi:hypothetical protein